ncbi:unnamed protein product [Polarella glacialis]|uniref:Methyltransferase FkbM domain-containing protein n=2 Tax=Polarella glacialis TaxID=89957 RepID=A0A813IT65_POLGL|nr:unnamed protein product [Polarella glacialis]
MTGRVAFLLTATALASAPTLSELQENGGVAFQAPMFDEVWAGLRCDHRVEASFSKFCSNRCDQILGSLRMRMDISAINHDLLQEGERINLWQVCPLGYRGMHLLKGVQDLGRLRRDADAGADNSEKVLGLLVSAEKNIRQLVLEHQNLTYSLGHIGAAIYFHIGQFLQELTHQFPEFPNLVPGMEVAEVAGTSIPSEMEALRLYLLQDAPSLGPLGARDAAVGTAELRRRGGKSIEIAALLLAQADFVRLKSGSYRPPGAEGPEFLRLLTLGSAFLMQAWKHELARAPSLPHTQLLGFLSLAKLNSVPIFDVLDRLDSDVVPKLFLLQARTEFTTEPFVFHVLPTKNVESNHVLSFWDLHCDLAFKEFAMVRRSRSVADSLFTVIEIGAHLGGCIVFAATHLKAPLRALAVEPYPPAAAALRRTVADNNLSELLAVDERFICSDPTLRFTAKQLSMGPALQFTQPVWDDAADSLGDETEGNGCATMDTVLQERGFDAESDIDLLRVHVLGRELDVLHSLKDSLGSGRIKALAVAILIDGDGNGYGGQDSVGIAKLLRSYGYRLEFYQKYFDDDVVSMLSTAPLVGTTTLFAQLDAHDLNSTGLFYRGR